ncbi:MAG TPA: thiamine-phosphate kinase [Bryobacteraceae bacterium]|nr:thiamine-phosphate kinase [Bryobacteraceae bacterium]
MASELEWIDRIRRRAFPGPSATLVLGIGDDCAVFRPRGSAEDLLFTTDLLVEGTHYLPATHSAEDVGWKTLARGLSDIAAMGGEPRFCLLSLALAPWQTGEWIDGFYRGLSRLARREKTPLAGGDLGHGGVAMCDIVVCGAVPRGTALLRGGARAGDAIYVSGALGGSALGLARGPGRRRDAAWKRHVRPEPRLALGRFLRQRVRATAAMDLSDGLSLDLRRLALESGVCAEIEAPPRFPGASLEQALHGGEDYELLFTASARTRVPAEFEGLPLTRIGTLRKGHPGDVTLDGEPLPPLGYDHLRKAPLEKSQEKRSRPPINTDEHR